MIVVSRRLRRWRAAFVTLLGAASLSNCRLDDLLSPGEFGTLDVTPFILEDSARVGSLAARTTTADLQIEGPGTLLNFSVQAELGSPWLGLSSATGSAPGTFSVSLDPTGLGVGEYRDTLRFAAEGPEEEPVRVPVLFRVLPCAITDLAAIPAADASALTTADCVSALYPDRYARRYRFNGAAGDSVTIQLTSAEFGSSVSLWAVGGATPLAESASCEATGSGACVRYILLPSTGTYEIEATSNAARSTGAFALTVGRPRAPVDPTTLEQRTGDGAGTLLTVGATHGAATLSFRSTLSDPDLDSLRMEVELRPIGSAFTGVATGASALGRGPVFSVPVAGLSDNTSYHWRARAVDVTGRTSAWVVFGGNANGVTDIAIAIPEAPAPPSALTQRRADGVTVIAAGGTTDETVVRLGGSLSDADPGDQVRLEVELRPVGVAFTGVASASSALLASGSSALVTVAGLADDTEYRWQARAVDATGRASAWVAFSPSGADLRTALPAAQLAVIAQPVGTAAGAVITPPVRIAAQDGSGGTLTSFAGNVTIALGANPTGATLGGTLTVAAVDGIATFTDLSITQVGSGYSLIATAGPLSTTTAPFDVSAATAQALEVGAVPASVTAGATIAPAVTVTVRDGFGNVASGFSGAVTLALTPNGAGATLLGTTTVAAVAGVATFADLRVERTANGLTLLAGASGVPNATGAPFAVTAAPAASLRIVTPPSSAAASGAPLAQQPTVVIEDAFGNPVLVAGTAVNASIASGPAGGSLAGANATTGATGVATFAGLAITGLSGSYTLSFSSGALPAVTSGAITLGVGAATQLVLVTPPSATAANDVVLGAQPQLQLRDAAGNDVLDDGVSVTVAIASGGGVLSGTTTVLTSTAGAAIFTDLALTGTVGPRTLSFTSSGLTGTSSGTIQLIAGAATQLALQAGDGQSAVAGGTLAIAPSVIARDVSGNPVAGVTVSFTASGGGGTIVPSGAVVTGANGIAALSSWTLGTAVGTNTLTAASDGLSGSPVTFTATATAGSATLLTITAGQDLTGPVGTVLGTAHEVRVTDANGNPVAGITVNWTAIGGGSVDPAISATDADGRATTTRTLGPTAGAQSTQAATTLSGGPTTATFNLIATVGGATQMSLVAGDAQADTVGATLVTPLSVLVRDALNNPVAGVLITWSAIDGGGLVLPASSLTNASGVATASWTLGTVTTPTDSTQLARASGVGTPVTFLATSRPASVSATQTLVTVAPASIAASRTTPATVTVTARDQFNNPIPNQPVSLAATGAGNTIAQPAAPTSATGVATGGIGATITGARTITATVNGIVATQQPTVTVVAAPAAQLVFTVPPANVVAGTGFAPSPTVGVLDSLGNANVTFVGMVTLAIGTNPAGGALSGTLTRNAIAGVAAFPGLSVDRAAVGYTLTASATGTTGATSDPFTVSAGGVAVVRSSIAAVPGTITAGGAGSTITVTARDANDNPIAGVTVVVSATGSGNTLTPQNSGTTDVSGTFSAALSSTTAEQKTVTATLDGAPLGQAATVTVTPGAPDPALSTVTVGAASIASGTTTTVTLTARDASGNALNTGGASVVFLLGAGTSDGTLGTTTDNGDGTYSAVFTATTSGTPRSIGATIGGELVTSVAPTIAVTAGVVSLAQSTVTVGSATVVSGATTTVTLTARDAAGNLLTTGGATVAYTLGAGTSGGTFGVTTDNGDGTYTTVFTATTSGTARSIGATIGGNAVTSTAPVITVTPGAVSLAQSTVGVGSPTVVSGATTTVTLTARDAAGNLLGTGGETVLFALGAGTSAGTLSVVADNADGTYSATFTATTAGTARNIDATIGGNAVTTTAPTITVTAGAASLAQSAVTVGAVSVVSGATTTVTLTTRDAAGNPLTAGGATVLFSLGAGTSAGTFGATTDNGDGSYSAVFTATTSGTARAILATLDGNAITSAAPTITVVSGLVSLAQSSVAVGSATVVSGATTTVTLTARDAVGNLIGAGGETVLFTLGAGTSAGTFSAVADNLDGTYTATFTATTSGTARNIGATIGGNAVTSAAPTITVTPGALSLAQSTVTVGAATVPSGATTTVTLTARDAAGNLLGTGGETVLFTLGAGTSGGTFGLTTDNGDGTYSAVFTATTTGTARSIGATVGGATVTSTAPTITVASGAVSLAQSTVAVGSTTVVSGAITTVTLTTRDAAGNLLGTGGETVLFTLGAGTSAGTFGTTTDNGDGTYSAVFTATASGTSRAIGATIGGNAVTSVAPTITVTPGALSLSQSTVTVGAATVVSGATSTVTFTARDAAGNLLGTGGETVAFTLGAGTSAGTFGVTTDNADGTYSAVFTATTTGTARSIGATVGGNAVSSAAPTITVTPGALSLAQSTVTVGSPTVVSGATTAVTLTARDAAGNLLGTGGETVLFTLGAGTSTGTFGAVTDNANGTYTATFTATTTGTARSIGATVDGNAVTSAAPTVTVTPGEISLALSTVSVGLASVASGDVTTVTLTTRDAAGNLLTAGGATVAFTLGAGTSAGTFGATTDNANGTYSAAFTATTTGTARAIGATVGGNAVTSAAPTITVTPGAVSAALTSVSATPGSIDTDGAASAVTVTARDAAGNLVPGVAVSLSASGTGNTVNPSAGVTDANGVFTSALTSTATGVKVVSAVVGTVAITQTASVTVTPGDVSAGTSTVEAAPTSIIAGSESSTITVTARDTNGNVIAGLPVSLAASGSGNTLTPSSGTTDANGQVSATFASSVAESKTLSATIDGVAITQAATVVVSVGGISAIQSTVAVDPTSIVAGGGSSAVTVTVRDGSGNAVSGVLVTLTASGTGNSITQPVGLTGSNGVATGSVSSTGAGVKSIGAIAGGITLAVPATLTVTPGAVSAAQSLLTASTGTITAGGAGSTITVTARDVNENPVPNQAVTVISSGAGNTFTPASGTTDANGVFTTTFTSTVAESKTISATAGGVGVTATAGVVVGVAAVSASVSTIAASPTSIVAATDTSVITVTARDAFGNAIANLGVALIADGANNTLIQPTGNTSGSGVATGRLASPTTGLRTIRAFAGGVELTSTATVTVVPGTASAALSTVSASPASIVALGAGSTITVTARDSSGNLIPGATVVLATTGTGNTLTPASGAANGAGVFVSTLTSSVAAAKTVSATVDGVAVTQTAAVTVTPGALSLSQSTVTVGSATVASGAITTVTLTARDAAGNLLGTGSETVLFTLGAGTSDGTFGVTTVNGNGTYSAVFTATTTGTARSIGATVGGNAVTSAAPTITVTPGALSLAQSTVTVGSATVISGATTTVTLTARDAAGNLVGTGGSTVLFTLVAGTSAGTFGVTTDNGNGTYSAVFTATTAGTARSIGATVGGNAVTSAAPTVTVTPGALSLAQSTVTVGTATVVSGAATTVTLTSRDAAGNLLGIGGETVLFTLGTGASSGTFGIVTDNANGTYTSSFTATTSGTARSIGATVGGNAVTSAAPTITVTPGALSLAQSTVTVAAATVASGSSTAVTLTARDAVGNLLGTGGETVLFTLGAGTSGGTFGVTTDIGNGTYTAGFTATTTGTARSIGATVGGNAVTSAAPTITVTPGAATVLEFVTQPSTTVAGAAISPAITIRALDAQGNVDTNFSDNVTLSLEPGTGDPAAAFTGGSTLTIAAIAGVATFDDVALDSVATDYRLIAAAAGVDPDTSANFTITVGPASVATSIVSLSSATVAVTATITATLVVRDSLGNRLPTGGLTVTFELDTDGNTSDGTFDPTSDAADGSYTAVFTGTVSGTPRGIRARIGGVLVTTAPPTIEVTP